MKLKIEVGHVEGSLKRDGVLFYCSERDGVVSYCLHSGRFYSFYLGDHQK